MANGHRLKTIIGWIALLPVVAFIVCAIVAIFVGPTSNLYAVGSLQPLSSQHPGGKVFVRNPELAEELEILRASGVFEIVSADEANNVVELHPREQGRSCGNPLLLTWATGGLVPDTVDWLDIRVHPPRRRRCFRTAICPSRGTTCFARAARLQAVSQRYANVGGHPGVRVRAHPVACSGQIVAMRSPSDENIIG